LGNFLSKHIYPSIIYLYLKTLRIKLLNEFPEKGIFIFWHSDMLAGWLTFKNKIFTALISKSKDGEILTNILQKLNYKIVRGSSSKDGKLALEEIFNDSKLKSVVLTPDGPRGPERVIKNGALILSNKLNIPVIPVKINFSNYIELKKSWDKFKIPYPFSKCEIKFGNAYYYTEYLEINELNNLKNKISLEL